VKSVEKILNIAIPIISVILTFGLAVFVHEFGHMIFALINRVGVDSFAIGMGPKICSWKWHGIEFSLRWLPLGGFVKLHGMVLEEDETVAVEPSEGETADGKTADSDQPEKGAEDQGEDKSLVESAYDDMLALSNKSLPVKLMVFGGGVFMNYLIAIIAMVGFLTLDKSEARIPLQIENVTAGSLVEKAGIRTGDQVKIVNGEQVEYIKDILPLIDEIGLSLGREDAPRMAELEIEVSRNKERVILHSPPMNINEFTSFTEIVLASLHIPPVIEALIDTFPAEKAGLEEGDRIVMVNGEEVSSFNRAAQIIRAHFGRSITIEVDRGGERLAFEMEPYESVETPGEGLIGIRPRFEKYETIKGMEFLPALKLAPSATWQKLKSLVETQVDFFKRASWKQIGQNIGGPVMIAKITASQAKRGLDHALNWFIVFNLLLLIFNLLPLPVLDGGFILLSIIESLARRPVPPRVLAPIYTVFVIFLIGLMATILVWDVIRIWL
jgi:regulator of sigma E protease